MWLTIEPAIRYTEPRGLPQIRAAGIPDALDAQRCDAERVPTLDALTTHWQWALEAGGRAVAAAEHDLGPHLTATHRTTLSHERARTLELLTAIARTEHAHVLPWLPAGPVTPHALGLPSGVRACVFDVDGVLADSGVLHASAWAQVFDDLLLRRSHESGWQFVPFDPGEDYRAYIDGRPRLEGVHAFLASRGIQVPTGEPSDGPEAETAYGIAARKGVALDHSIHHAGVSGLPGARAYLLGAAFAHLARAVVSTSATTAHVLEHANLASLVDVFVDGRALVSAGLRPRPAPDMLLAACERLGVPPAETVSFTRSASGLAAAHAAGMRAIAVARNDQAERLSHLGAERVVASLAELLDPQLRAG